MFQWELRRDGPGSVSGRLLKSARTVMLSPSLVILSEAKDLALAAQGKLSEASRGTLKFRARFFAALRMTDWEQFKTKKGAAEA